MQNREYRVPRIPYTSETVRKGVRATVALRELATVSVKSDILYLRVVRARTTKEDAALPKLYCLTALMAHAVELPVEVGKLLGVTLLEAGPSVSALNADGPMLPPTHRLGISFLPVCLPAGPSLEPVLEPSRYEPYPLHNQSSGTISATSSPSSNILTVELSETATATAFVCFEIEAAATCRLPKPRGRSSSSEAAST